MYIWRNRPKNTTLFQYSAGIAAVAEICVWNQLAETIAGTLAEPYATVGVGLVDLASAAQARSRLPDPCQHAYCMRTLKI